MKDGAVNTADIVVNVYLPRNELAVVGKEERCWRMVSWESKRLH